MAWTDPRTWTDGELVTAAIMNTHVRDNLRLVPHVIRKTADESVTSSATPQNDDHLLFAIAANEVWSVKAVLWHTSASATPDFRFTFAMPAGGIFHFNTWGLDTDDVTFSLDQLRSSSDHATVRSDSTNALSIGEGIFVNAGTAGNVNLQWAQSVSNATATTLKTNSYLIIAKLA